MKRFLQNWLMNGAFIIMLLSATNWSHAHNFNGVPAGTETETDTGPCPTWYADNDSDGFGDLSMPLVSCVQPVGYVSNSTDCDDADPTVWRKTNLFIDIDGDGFYGGYAFDVCWGAVPPVGHSTTSNGTDCNDNDPTLWNNADFYVDVDGDNYTKGPAADICYGAVPPAGVTQLSLGKDCDDNDPTLWFNDDLYIDADGDGYDNGIAEDVCRGATAPPGYSLTTLGADCDDTNAAINPGATEIQGNHIDENCNGDEDDAIGDFFTQLKPSQCDGTLLYIYNACVAEVNTLNVTQYYYEITHTGTNAKQVYNTADSFFQLTDLASYEYDTTYAIRCGMDVGGFWQGYGSECYVTTPSLTSGATAIVIPQCGTTLTHSYSPIFVTGPHFISSYEVSATNLTTLVNETIVRTQSWFTLKMMPTIYDYDTDYMIQVRVATTEGYSDWTAPCMVSTPAQGAKMANPATTLSPVAYPNPFDAEFTLNLPKASEAVVQVKVYDMIGNILEVRDVKGTSLEAQRLGENFPTGVYNVILTQDGISESIRVIKR